MGWLAFLFIVSIVGNPRDTRASLKRVLEAKYVSLHSAIGKQDMRAARSLTTKRFVWRDRYTTARGDAARDQLFNLWTERDAEKMFVSISSIRRRGPRITASIRWIIHPKPHEDLIFCVRADEAEHVWLKTMEGWKLDRAHVKETILAMVAQGVPTKNPEKKSH